MKPNHPLIITRQQTNDADVDQWQFRADGESIEEEDVRAELERNPNFKNREVIRMTESMGIWMVRLNKS